MGRIRPLDEAAGTTDPEAAGTAPVNNDLPEDIQSCCGIVRVDCRSVSVALMRDASVETRDFAFLRPRHFRAARALLDWTQDDLATRAGVVRRTIVMLECGGCRTQRSKVEAVLAALGAGGIRFARAAEGEISLIDGNAELEPVPSSRGDKSKPDRRLHTRVSGRHHDA